MKMKIAIEINEKLDPQESIFEMGNCMAKIIAEDFAKLKLIRTIEYLQIFL